MNYYNEFDPFAAAWLRELISQRLIPRGLVDDRSITEVQPEDLEGFTQCHFFAGIGGWPLALQLAGISHRTPLWTGSPPCQPFSVAGKQLGQLDERHLAPTFMRLVAQCRPPVLFGEQVAAAIGKHWLDDLFTELEEQDYTCGAAVLPACSVGAPHKRDRLFFGAVGDAPYFSQYGRGDTRARGRDEHSDDGGAGCVAESNSEQQRQVAKPGKRNEHAPSGRDEDSAEVTGLCGDNSTNPHHGFWSDADWLGCRDGKFRPVEPGAFPLANGIPARVGRLRDEDLQSNPQKNRVGRLRGYGNAIVPQVAAEFIKAFMEAKNAI